MADPVVPEVPVTQGEYVVLRRSDVEALMEEHGDLDQDPFWRPVENVRVVRMPPPRVPFGDESDPRYAQRGLDGTA